MNAVDVKDLKTVGSNKNWEWISLSQLRAHDLNPIRPTLRPFSGKNGFFFTLAKLIRVHYRFLIVFTQPHVSYSVF